MKTNVTIIQLAEEAGVSTATVSRVLKGHPLVAQETRERVQQLIDKYHYTPSFVARSLARQQSNMLGMIVQDIENPYFAALYLRAENYAISQGYTLLMVSSLTPESEQDSLKRLMERQVDGIVMISSSIDRITPQQEITESILYAVQRVPMILINEPVNEFEVPFVAPGNYEGYKSATEYLLALGHRKIAFIGGSQDNYTMQLRYKAFTDTLESHHVDAYPSMVRMDGYSYEDGAKAMSSLLSTGMLPTAVICVNDTSALGVIKVCQQQRIRIPDDISIISCDNTFISQAVCPDLTSIDILPGLQGETAVKLLLQMIEGETIAPVTRLDSRLIIRGSTARPQADFAV